MKNQYFGERWYAAAYTDAVEVPVPLGASCLYCDELIDEDDSGVFMHYGDKDGLRDVPVHIECQLRAILGSVEHLEKRCTCFGGDVPDGTSRAQAKATLAWLREHPGTI